MVRVLGAGVFIVSLLGCDSDFTTPDIVLVNLGIDPVSTENMNTSYHRSKPASLAPAVTLPVTTIDYSTLARPDATRPINAIAYLDVEDDGDLDVFVSSGINLTTVDYFDEIYFNDALNTFTYNVTDVLVDYTDPANPVGPKALNASKALVSDFTGNALDDIFVLDQGIDEVSFKGASPRLFIHQTELSDPNDIASPLIHSFTYQIYSQDPGYQTTGASADIDNDGDTDIFVGGLEPFFYINNGFGGFLRVDNRWDQSMSEIHAAELVDVDMDGYVDLIAGADEATNATFIYWGNSTGAYKSEYRTELPTHTGGYEVILDFEVEHLDADSNKDIVIYRTSVADTDRVVQIIKNNGGRNFTVNTSFPTGTSSRWLRVQNMDIYPDNAVSGSDWFDNDGNGVFTPTIFP
ncbi:MAG: VCBS repeat-containing protein [Gammaproteobacteria bacterium]|nr:VCBS repeat-containing protein [Gammaproteobacteria bacterium]